MEDATYPERPFLVGLPPEVLAEWNARRERAGGTYIAGDVRRAIELMAEAYDYLVGLQPPGHRFHKGFALHQLGLWYVERGEPARALEHFLGAFVEDVLSRGEESPTNWDELGRPAAQVLVFTFGLAGPQLIDLAARIRVAQSEGRLYTTPGQALDEHPAFPTGAQAEAAAKLVAEPSEPYPPAWRELGDFGTPMERRVFVGGSYLPDKLGALRATRDQARECGWDGVLVAEFLSPPGMDNRTKSLICLMGCRRAVFNLSASGGHQVEFDKLVDFGIRDVLVVFDSSQDETLRISSLTQAWFPSLHITARPYHVIPELRAMVKEWLGCDGATGELPADRVKRLSEEIGADLGSLIGERLRDFLGAEVGSLATEGPALGSTCVRKSRRSGRKK